MAEQPRWDVWIVRIKRVYRNVPFVVVADRVQQGRLTAEDRVRPSGSAEWHSLAQVPLLAPYLPQPVPYRAEDQAEALEPVELGLGDGRPSEMEEDDPDMIPLIDISLVLLIFFMMTAGSLIVASVVETPPAETARVRATGARDTLTINMAMAGAQVRYYLGDQAEEPLREQELLDQVARRMREGAIEEVVVKANPWIPYETVRQLLIGLERLGVKNIQAGVRDRRVEEEQP